MIASGKKKPGDTLPGSRPERDRCGGRQENADTAAWL